MDRARKGRVRQINYLLSTAAVSQQSMQLIRTRRQLGVDPDA